MCLGRRAGILGVQSGLQQRGRELGNEQVADKEGEGVASSVLVKLLKSRNRSSKGNSFLYPLINSA